MSDVRDDLQRIDREITAGLKDFQVATVDHLYDLYEGGAKGGF